MGASYSGLYEEGEVEHINFPPMPVPDMFAHPLRQSYLKIGNSLYNPPEVGMTKAAQIELTIKKAEEAKLTGVLIGVTHTFTVCCRATPEVYYGIFSHHPYLESARSHLLRATAVAMQSKG